MPETGVAIVDTGAAPQSAPKPPAARSSWALLAYGGLTLPLTLAEIPILIYLPAFYAQELGLKPGLVGVVFLAARLWDGLSDVFVGWASDRTVSRFGRRKPWVLAGTPFLVISTWFLCNPPPGADLLHLIVWAALFYTSFTAVKIPHLSWGTELATDYVERSRVTAFRETFTMLGNLFFVTAPLLFLAQDAPLKDVLFLISIIMLWLTPLTTLPLSLVKDIPQDHRTETHLFKGLLSLVKDGIFVRFAIATLLVQLQNGITNSLAVFAFAVGLELPDKILWSIFVLYIAMLVALPVTMHWARRAEKHLLLAGGTAVYALAVIALLWVPMRNFPAVATLWIVAGFGSAAMFFLPTSMLADIIDCGEVTMGERRSGTYVAVYNLVSKIGLALGVGISFALLEWVNYDPAASEHGITDAENIRLLAFGLPSLLLAPAIALYWKHPITRKVQQQLRIQINARADLADNVALGGSRA